MNEFCVIYYDLVEIPVEILSVVNIKNYGSLHYRKQKLAKYHEQIFKDNGISIFCHIKSNQDLDDFLDYYSRSNIKNFIFQSSSFAIVNPVSFSDFISRLKYIDSSLGVFQDNEIRSFLKLEKNQAIDLLEMLKVDKNNVDLILKQNFNSLEKFRKEDFYLQISNYIEFIKFLHSNFELRYFNSLQTNGLVITKSSTKKSKMLSEYKYYEFVPEGLKIYFLRPFNFVEEELNAQYSLEQLNVPDLAIQWIHYSINTAQFEILLERIFTFINLRTAKVYNQEVVQKSILNLYVDKLNDRLNDFKKTEIYFQIDSIISRSTKYKNIDEIFSQYFELYKKLSVSRKNEIKQHFGHGDLCFSNILYDKRIDFIKFIDPKGCTNENEAYFDQYYDLAKLSHSILGNYDFINNGIFSINFDNSLQISLNIEWIEDNKEYGKIFEKFLQKNGFDFKMVRLYEASLFLSMLPLHIDFPKKVLAFVLTAIQILDSLER